MYHNYNDDLKEEISTEQIVRRDLESLGAKFLKWNDENNKYDLAMEMQGKVLMFATMLDQAKTKKDFFIEYHRDGKSSFLDATEAQVLAFVFPNLNEIWYVQTLQLEDHIHRSNTIQDTLNRAKNARGWIMTREELKPLAMIRPIKPKDTKSI